jgi:small-conductance mechanosensitive channel
MNFYSFGIVLSFSLLAFACEETNPNKLKKESLEVEKDNLKDKKVSNSEKEIPEHILEEQTKQSNNTNSIKSKEPVVSTVSNSIAKKQASTKKQAVEEKKVVIPTKWKNTYSQDKKWMELYESSRSFFLNGWDSEFERNPGASISRDELLLAYRKRMENIFYETPSFIEFCVQEMKVSAEFELFCQKWNENVN